MFPGSDVVHMSWAGPKVYVLDEIKFFSFLTGMWSSGAQVVSKSGHLDQS